LTVVRPLSWLGRDHARAYRKARLEDPADSVVHCALRRPAEYDQCCRWNARNDAARRQLRETPLLGVGYPDGIAWPSRGWAVRRPCWFCSVGYCLSSCSSVAAQRHMLMCNVPFRPLSARRANYNNKLSDVRRYFISSIPRRKAAGRITAKAAGCLWRMSQAVQKSRSRLFHRRDRPRDHSSRSGGKDYRAVQQLLDRPVRSSPPPAG